MTMKCEKTNIRECAIKSCEARIKHLQMHRRTTTENVKDLGRLSSKSKNSRPSRSPRQTSRCG